MDAVTLKLAGVASPAGEIARKGAVDPVVPPSIWALTMACDPLPVETGDAHLQHVARTHRRRERGGDAAARDLQQVGEAVRREHARRDDGVLDQQAAQRLRIGRELSELGVDQRGQIRLWAVMHSDRMQLESFVMGKTVTATTVTTDE